MLLINENAPESNYKNLCLECCKHTFNFFKAPWKLLFSNTIFYENYSLLAFLTILVYITVLSRYLIYSVELVVQTLPFSHVFIGLTFASWGGNISGIYFLFYK